MKITFKNSFKFFLKKNNIEEKDINKIFNNNQNLIKFFSSISKPKDKAVFVTERVQDYVANSQSEAEEFISNVLDLGKQAAAIFSAITAIADEKKINHDTRADQSITVFGIRKGIKNDEWDIYAIGFHDGNEKKGAKNSTYDLKYFYQPDGPYQKGRHTL